MQVELFTVFVPRRRPGIRMVEEVRIYRECTHRYLWVRGRRVAILPSFRISYPEAYFRSWMEEGK